MVGSFERQRKNPRGRIGWPMPCPVSKGSRLRGGSALRPAPSILCNCAQWTGIPAAWHARSAHGTPTRTRQCGTHPVKLLWVPQWSSGLSAAQTIESARRRCSNTHEATEPWVISTRRRIKQRCSAATTDLSRHRAVVKQSVWRPGLLSRPACLSLGGILHVILDRSFR